MEDRRRRRGWRLCRQPGLWRWADPAREWKTRKPPTCAAQTWTASLSGTECRRWQDPRAPLTLIARENLRARTDGIRACTLWAGTHKVRSFAKGQGRGWPWSKTPSCHRLRPGGENGKRCPEERPELLNITSRCVTRSRHKDDLKNVLSHTSKADTACSAHARSYAMLCYVMTRILDTDGDAKGIHSPGVYCTSLWRLGGIKPARVCGC